MLRLLFILMALSFAAGVAQAEVIYIEDFEDEQGNPGFDPMFNHSITLLDDTGYDEIIDGGIQCNRPDDWLLYLSNAHDLVTFNLQPNQVVVSASIEIVFPGFRTCGFVGEDGETRVDNFHSGVFETTHQEIGHISSIWLQGYGGIFNDIKIKVAEVPEPGVAYGLIVIGLLCVAIRIRHQSQQARS